MGLLKKIGKIAQVAGAVTGQKWLSTAGSVAGALDSGGGGGGGGSATSAQAPGFVPYGVTTGFGTSKIDAANKTATYSLDPRLQSFRDRMYGGATTALDSADPAYAYQNINYAKGLFGQATNMDIGSMTQDYFNKNLALLEPAREAESSRLNDLMFSKGTLGAGVGMEGGYVNPQQFALAKAREQENSRLALASEDRARAIQGETLQRANAMYGLGQSYLTQPYDTANTLFGMGSNIEALGANSMALGLNMGSTAGQLNNEAAAYNKAINQQNWGNQLYNQATSRDTWSGALDQIGTVDWGKIWGRTPDFNPLPDSQSFDSFNNSNYERA
jgi:hypothetical protein